MRVHLKTSGPGQGRKRNRLVSRQSILGGAAACTFLIGTSPVQAASRNLCRIWAPDFYSGATDWLVAETDNIALATSLGRRQEGKRTYFDFLVKEAIKGRFEQRLTVSFGLPFRGDLPPDWDRLKDRSVGYHFDHHTSELFRRWRHSNVAVNNVCSAIRSSIVEGSDYLIFFHGDGTRGYEFKIHFAAAEYIEDTTKDAWYRTVRKRVARSLQSEDDDRKDGDGTR